jgi:hypothetical protein
MRPAGGAEPETPKWMHGIETLTPGKAFSLGVLILGLNPKNLILTLGAATALAQLGLSTVLLGSLTIAGPIVYYLLGGASAKTKLNELKGWLGVPNASVMMVLFLVLGVDVVAKGIPPLTG